LKLVHALVLAAVLAGCSSHSERDSGQPAPRVTQTVTATPTPTDTPTADVTHYRMMTVVQGHADVTFVVALNGNTVGTLNGNTNGDLTPSVLPGDNTVAVSWTLAHPLKSDDKATLTIERQIPAQDGWTTVYSREVDFTTKVKDAKGTFANEAMGDNSAAEGTLDTSTGGGDTPANSSTGSNVPIPSSGSNVGGSNISTGSNVTGGPNTTTGSNTTGGSNPTTGSNATRGTNTTTGANLTQPRPAISPNPTTGNTTSPMLR